MTKVRGRRRVMYLEDFILKNKEFFLLFIIIITYRYIDIDYCHVVRRDHAKNREFFGSL